MSRVSKKEDQFYTMFKELSAEMVIAADCYYDIIAHYPDQAVRIVEMKRYETECDELLRKIFQELSVSFITPFDREDISELIRTMDDVVDDMENVARRYELFHVKENRPEAEQMASLARDAVHDMDVLFQHFPDFRHDKVVVEQAEKISTIEDMGDHVFHGALARLFDETDSTATHLLKWNTMFNKMEDILDSCKDVATIVSNVVLKNA